jgi:hypothetical protein
VCVPAFWLLHEVKCGQFPFVASCLPSSFQILEPFGFQIFGLGMLNLYYNMNINKYILDLGAWRPQIIFNMGLPETQGGAVSTELKKQQRV